VIPRRSCAKLNTREEIRHSCSKSPGSDTPRFS
jgi:hypothetical protein